MFEKTSILGLPKQELPGLPREPGAFVATWLVTITLSACSFHWLLKKKIPPIWPEYEAIKIGCLLLTFWYLLAVVDRWLHFHQWRVSYGYVVFLPIAEFFRFSSTILFLWGTYTIVWKDLKDRVPQTHHRWWWIAAKFLTFIVGLFSLFHWVLSIVQAAVWIQFLSLDTIADITSKRWGFTIAMVTFYMLFALVIVAAATTTFVLGFAQDNGKMNMRSAFFFSATLMLLARSIAELALTSLAYRASAPRQGNILVGDVAYGLLTTMFLIFMLLKAWREPVGRDSHEIRVIQSNVRKEILRHLDGAQGASIGQYPPFEQVLRALRNGLPASLHPDGALAAGSKMAAEDANDAATQYLDTLDAEFQNWVPIGRVADRGQGGSRSRFNSVLDRRPASGPPMSTRSPRTASNPAMRAAGSSSVHGSWQSRSPSQSTVFDSLPPPQAAFGNAPFCPRTSTTDRTSWEIDGFRLPQEDGSIEMGRFGSRRQAFQ